MKHWLKFLVLQVCIIYVYLAPCGSRAHEEKQRLQHSIQISRQSADSQQASMMPQSMSQGKSQSPHSSDAQQQQKHESSPAQEPQVAQSSTMLHRVRNSQKRQASMQWTQQSREGQRDRKKWVKLTVCSLHLKCDAANLIRKSLAWISKALPTTKYLGHRIFSRPDRSMLIYNIGSLIHIKKIHVLPHVPWPSIFIFFLTQGSTAAFVALHIRIWHKGV